jgi:hypothetical protein
LPIESFAEVFVLPAILGAAGSNIAHWVGTFSRTCEAAPDPNTLHRIRTHIIPSDVEGGQIRFVVGEVTLFANAPAPEYIVVVGVLRGDAQIPEKFEPVVDDTIGPTPSHRPKMSRGLRAAALSGIVLCMVIGAYVARDASLGAASVTGAACAAIFALVLAHALSRRPSATQSLLERE